MSGVGSEKQAGALRKDWQGDDALGPICRLFVEPNSTAYSIDHEFGNGEAKPCSTLLCGSSSAAREEALEDSLMFSGRYSRTLIMERYREHC